MADNAGIRITAGRRSQDGGTRLARASSRPASGPEGEEAEHDDRDQEDDPHGTQLERSTGTAVGGEPRRLAEDGIRLRRAGGRLDGRHGEDDVAGARDVVSRRARVGIAEKQRVRPGGRGDEEGRYGDTCRGAAESQGCLDLPFVSGALRKHRA